MMKDRLSGLYEKTVRAALIMFQSSDIMRGGQKSDKTSVPVVPGTFPGECVDIIYSQSPAAEWLSITVQVPSSEPSFRLPSLRLYESTGPFLVQKGKMPVVPDELTKLLSEFAQGGPERLTRMFRGLLKELMRAGVTAEDLRGEVEAALAESVMEE